MAEKNTRKSKKDEQEPTATAPSDIALLIQTSITQTMGSVKSELMQLLDDKLNSVQNQLSKSLSDHLAQMDSRFAKLQEVSSSHSNRLSTVEENLKVIEQRYDAMDNHLQDGDDQQRAASTRMDLLSSEILQLKKHNNHLDQASRSLKLRVSGLSLDKLYPKESFVSFCRDRLNLDTIQTADVDQIQFIPMRREHAAPSPPLPIILVTFFQGERRNLVLRGRRCLKGSGIRIFEDLTTTNIQFMDRLRKNPKIKSSWSWNGKVYAILENSEKIMLMDPFSLTLPKAVEPPQLSTDVCAPPAS